MESHEKQKGHGKGKTKLMEDQVMARQSNGKSRYNFGKTN